MADELEAQLAAERAAAEAERQRLAAETDAAIAATRKAIEDAGGT